MASEIALYRRPLRHNKGIQQKLWQEWISHTGRLLRRKRTVTTSVTTSRALTRKSDDNGSDEVERQRPSVLVMPQAQHTVQDQQRKSVLLRLGRSSLSAGASSRRGLVAIDITQRSSFVADFVINPVKSPRGNYTSVRCLLLWWADDNLNCSKDVRGMAAVLSDRYGYSIQAWQIPSGDSSRHLKRCVTDFANDTKAEKELLVVFYSGHGSAGDTSNPGAAEGLEWSATDRSDSPALARTPIQNGILAKASQDVLLILDCCYAGSALKGPGTQSRKELLAACGWECPTVTGKTSYTANLVYWLKKLQGPFEYARYLACDEPIVVVHAALDEVERK
ncbi:hypothetical protein LTR49_014668 [Elasticomyces elasticus]|nr:hypothetical protein LTR49_014668 [Elasticomyces elasticus]KAK5752529.1 hypothetical protein LTS12_017371 [Elasticomyces elasticus]